MTSNTTINTSAAFSINLAVRDYECDLAGGVNNAVYMSYFEHARHEYLKSVGLNFSQFAEKKIGLVIVSAQLDFKWPLVSGDHFSVSVKVNRTSRLRFQFVQEILRQDDQKLICTAIINGTVVDERNRPCMPPEIEAVFGPFVPTNV